VTETPISSRRRGYLRPQGTEFSKSARHRDSVLSLGSIRHVQSYFARTGLLDGKGGQLSRGDIKKNQVKSNDTNTEVKEDEERTFNADNDDETMLPPTVSTYRPKVIESQPPPNLEELRDDLLRNLESSRQVLQETEDNNRSDSVVDIAPDSQDVTAIEEKQGWYEVQGLHILDTVTLTIRAAKDYYTLHPQPEIMFNIKSEREIRGDLYQVLDVLKRMANRNFAQGIKAQERTDILNWISSIKMLLDQEQSLREEIHSLRSQWPWLHDEGRNSWKGRAREREHAFLSSFDNSTVPLPRWTEQLLDPETESPTGPSPFLSSLASGLRLVQLHNSLVKQSSRHFGEITFFYTDTAKPYRCAENLRFWIKAAELRWEVKLGLNDGDVLDIVYDRRDKSIWRKFDGAVLKWCTNVREELSREWTSIDNHVDGNNNDV